MKCNAALCILVAINPAPKMLILCIALLKLENKQEQVSAHSPALTGESIHILLSEEFSSGDWFTKTQ